MKIILVSIATLLALQSFSQLIQEKKGYIGITLGP